MAEDLALLQQYTKTQDPDAFTELVNRYAGLVHGTCLRITANEHDAQDVTQECFMELARKSASVTSCLGGWLHFTASSRSKNAIRSSVRRRKHEGAAIDDTEPQKKEATWEQIAPLVDGALAELPDDLRLPLVLHYLQGKTQAAIASELDLNQSTVSRRLESGVGELRNRLRKSGAIVSMAILTTMLTTNVASAAPAAVVAALGKMAMAGVGGTSATRSAGTTTFFGTAAGKVAAIAVAGTMVVGAVTLSRRAERQQSESPNKAEIVMKEAKTATAIEPKKEAQAFLNQHRKFYSFNSHYGWKDADVEKAREKALSIAEQFKGTDVGAQALLLAARATGGRCGMSPGDNSGFGWNRKKALYDDGWDEAIQTYERVTQEYPKSEHAIQARWLIATCHGNWAWSECCRDNQGKKDWDVALQMYEGLYESSGDDGSKCEALRRMMEIRFHVRGEREEGLALYKRILEEFPEGAPPSPYVSNRTCSPFAGTVGIDCDVVLNNGQDSRYTLRHALENASTLSEAVSVRDEFVNLSPNIPSIESHSLLLLQKALLRLGEDEQAQKIKEEMGLCEQWLAVGPFFSEGRDMDVYPFSPEKDVLSKGLDIEHTYEASTEDGRTGKAMWIFAGDPSQPSIWELGKWGDCTARGAFYALTYVQSAKAQTLQLRVGTSSGMRVWLNGDEVLFLTHKQSPHAIMDGEIRDVSLSKGENALLVRFSPATWGGNFIRIADAKGKAPASISYSVPKVPDGNRKNSDFLQ